MSLCLCFFVSLFRLCVSASLFLLSVSLLLCYSASLFVSVSLLLCFFVSLGAPDDGNSARAWTAAGTYGTAFHVFEVVIRCHLDATRPGLRKYIQSTRGLAL